MFLIIFVVKYLIHLTIYANSIRNKEKVLAMVRIIKMAQITAFSLESKSK